VTDVMREIFLACYFIPPKLLSDSFLFILPCKK